MKNELLLVNSSLFLLLSLCLSIFSIFFWSNIFKLIDKYIIYILVAIMARTKEGQILARWVVQLYERLGRAAAPTVAHFVLEGAKRTTVCAILRRYKGEGRIEYSGGNRC
jgi:hypothetical protein